MIYLIGGPPKCGKTTFAKILSKKLGIPWISADTLQSIGRAYAPKSEDIKNYPHAAIRKGSRSNDEFYQKYSAKQIVSAYRKQAKATFPAIEMTALCEMTDGNSYIIEGYQVEPAFVAKLAKKYGKENITSLFLTKTDVGLFTRDAKKSTTPNDWILTKTKKDETFAKIAEMVRVYSLFFADDAETYGFRCIDLSRDFAGLLKRVAKEFSS